MALEIQAGPQQPLYSELSQRADRVIELSLETILMSPDALDQVEAGLDREQPVLIVQDDTVMYRHGQPVKTDFVSQLRTAGFTVDVLSLGADPVPDGNQVAAVRDSLTDNLTVIALGSGVIADIVKRAVSEFEDDNKTSLHLVIVQTANSVCAFTSSMSVLTIDGVKRTLESRLPDSLVLDTQLLADAPREYTLGGVGDAAVSAVSFADYRLSHLLGLSGWEPLSWALMQFSRNRFLSKDPVLSGKDPKGMEATAVDLSACGYAMTLAGESAPLSGLEHVTSHMLDMAAPMHNRPLGNHGSQCALAGLLSLIAWQVLLDQDALPAIDQQRLDESHAKTHVERIFTPIDGSGDAWRECWNDYSTKIRAWSNNREHIDRFLETWADQRTDLQQFVVDPAHYVEALVAAGHPVRWEKIPDGITEDHARWAFTNAHLMRKRTSVADLLNFTGQWNEQLVDKIFATYRELTKSQK